MTVGMFLAAMAFVCAAVVQLQIDQTLPVFPSTSQSQLKLLNMGNNKVTVTLPNHKPVELNAAKASEEYYTFENDQITVSTGSPTVTKSVPLTMSKRQTLLIPANLSDKWPLTYDLTSKPQKGNNAVRFINGMTQRVNVSIAGADFELIEPFSYTNYSLIKNGKTTIIIQRESQSCKFIREFGFGSSYGFLIPSTFTFAPECQTSIPEVEYIKPNSVHMALQIPQYFFITAGEVMFSVTGLEFSYSQAPSNMKAVLQAGWLLTVAVGNFIVLIVAEVAKLPQKWAEYLLFASLLVVVCIIFSIMAYFYTYIDPTEIEAQFRKKTDDDDKHKNTQKAGVEMKKKDSWQDRDEDDRGKQT